MREHTVGSDSQRQAHATRKVIIFLFFALCINCRGRSWIVEWHVCRRWLSVWVSALGTVDGISYGRMAQRKQRDKIRLKSLYWSVDGWTTIHVCDVCVCVRRFWRVQRHSLHLYRKTRLRCELNKAIAERRVPTLCSSAPAKHTIHVRSYEWNANWVPLYAELNRFIWNNNNYVNGIIAEGFCGGYILFYFFGTPHTATSQSERFTLWPDVVIVNCMMQSFVAFVWNALAGDVDETNKHFDDKQK